MPYSLRTGRGAALPSYLVIDRVVVIEPPTSCKKKRARAKTSMAEELQQKTGRYGCEFDCGFTSDEFDAVVQHEHVSCQAFQVD